MLMPARCTGARRNSIGSRDNYFYGGIIERDAAERCLGEAVAVSRQQDAKFLELRASVKSRSGSGVTMAKRAEARALLVPVYEWFTEGFDTPDLQKAKALLEDLRR